MSSASSWYRAEKKARSEARFRTSNGNVAAIDFGTTFCSIAYSTAGDDEIGTIKLNGIHPRVPTAILLVPDDEITSERGDSRTPAYKVAYFGYRAQKEHAKMRSADRKRSLYFERIKMNLQHDQAVDRNMTVNAFNDQEFYLAEVIAFILKHLKDQLEENLSRTSTPLKAAEFDWVITVPAIWMARGKRMMREAGYMAGLCSSGQTIDRFSCVGSASIPKPQELNPEKLSLALEPEAAAIFCQQMDGLHVASYCDAPKVLKSDRYLVLDIGGGTVDITAHRLDSSRNIEVLTVPSGNDWGGTKVNKEFSKFLQMLVNDEAETKACPSVPVAESIDELKEDKTVTKIGLVQSLEGKADTEVKDFPKFVCRVSPEKMPARRAIINQLLYEQFEDQKVTFGEDTGDKSKTNDYIAVKLPPEFVACYGNDFIETQVKKLGDERIDYEDETLFIDHSKVQEIFQPAVDGIMECTIASLEKLQGEIDTIYIVGGFGGCKYIYEKVAAQVKAKFGEKTFQLIVPSQHKLAVAQGAVLYRKSPEVISSRKVDATYGTAVTVLFQRGKHDRKFKFYDEDGVARCDNVLKVYMEVGEVARAEDVISSVVIPGSNLLTVMHIDILSTFKSGVKYIIDSKGERTVKKIGELILDIPNKDNLPRSQRKVEITMDFSHTEIQAQAKYLVTEETVKTTVDFLSVQ